MKIIVINGQGKVGKDSFVDYCKENNAYVQNLSTIDPIKALATKIGWNGQKTDRDRRFLSDLKDLTSKYNDYPYIQTIKAIEDLVWDYHYYNLPTKNMIIFLHCREPEDIDVWKRFHGARTLLIRRRDVEEKHGNHADDNVFDMVYDYTIYNEGSLLDLKKEAEKFMKKVLDEEWQSRVERERQ